MGWGWMYGAQDASYYAWMEDDTSFIEPLERITRNPAVMGGKACIRGMRVTAGMIVRQIGSGTSIEELLDAYPYLEREDVMQALLYAGWLASGYEVDLAEA